MYAQIKPISGLNPILKKENFQYTLFAVKKPENVSNSTMVIETSDEGYLIKNYATLSNGEIKKNKYISSTFVTAEKHLLDFSFELYSDFNDLIMKTTLRCQILITDPIHIVKDNILEICEPLSQLISEQVNNSIIVNMVNNTEELNNLIFSLPNSAKRVFNEYMQIENCRLIDTVITDEGKKEKERAEERERELERERRRQREKEMILEAMRNNDMYDLVENEEKVRKMFDMRDDVLRGSLNTKKISEEAKRDLLKTENETYDIMAERYGKLRDGGMIPPDVSMHAYMKKLSGMDSDFIVDTIEDKGEVTEEPKAEQEEKAYFDEE